MAQSKRKNPSTKAPLMKILTDSIAIRNGKPIENEDTSKLTDEELGLDSIGCTANVVISDFFKRKIFVANAGDSRCVMGHGGKCKPLSFDHKPAN